MAIRLARWLCVSSLVFLAQAQAQVRDRPFLTPQQLEEPAAVVAWLHKHGASADRKRAAQAHEFGVSEQKRGAIANALKGYGEAVLRLPTARAIVTYTDLSIKYHGELRTHLKDHEAFQTMDLRSFESLYRSALASDEFMPALSAQERARITADAACIAAFLRDRSGFESCGPLKAYGARLLPAKRKR